MKKFNSLDELETTRKKVGSKFKDGMPTYLTDYFDKEFDRITLSASYKAAAVARYSHTDEERYEYKKKKEEEFWEKNDYEIVKSFKAGPTEFNMSFKEPVRNPIQPEERDLSPEELRVLVKLCENDLYLFAIRYFPHYLKRPSSKLHRFLYLTLSRDLNKYAKGVKWAIAAPRANAKCLDENTIIQLSNGSLKKIKEVQVGDRVISFDSGFKLIFSTITGKECSGTKKVREMRLKSGRRIIASDEHRFYSINGPVLFKDLRVGDKIATPKFIKREDTKPSMSQAEAIFLANMIAEGSLSSNNSKYTNFDQEVVFDFANACDELGFEVVYTKNFGQYNIRKCRNYLRKYKLWGHSSLTKVIPDEIFRQDDEFIKTFISRFFATDGWVSKYNLCAGITLANEKLIQQLFTLFLMLGFKPYIHQRPNKKHGAWAVCIYGREDLNKLYNIGILHKQDKLELTLNSKKDKKSQENFDTIPSDWRKYLNTVTPYFFRKLFNERVDNNYNISREKLKRVANIDNNDFLRCLADSEIFWAEIESISDYFGTTTYDIEVDSQNSSFVANNIFSHNSTLVSGIFPIWCLCYEKKQFIILLSDTLSQAEDFLYDIKQELEFNEKLRRDFPKVAGKGPIWRTNEIVTNNTLKILALGTGQKIRGRKFGVHRPDLVIGDDIENSDMVRSEVQREFIRYEWFNKEVIFAGGEEGSSTDFFIVGTSIGKLALLNALLDPDQYPEWKGMRFRAVEKFHDLEADELWEQWTTIYKDRFDPERKDHAREFYDKNKELMLKGAVVLWPDGDPYYGLMEYKLSNLSGFLCFDENTEVVLENGSLKKIKEVQEGELVLTHDGSSQRVLKSISSELGNRKIVDIKIAGHMDKIRVTDDHFFMVWPDVRYKCKSVTHQHLGKFKGSSNSRILENKIVWKMAKDIKVRDSVVFPIVKKDKPCSCHNPDWYWILGLYLAEGSFGANNSFVAFNMAIKEISILEKCRELCEKLGYTGANTIHINEKNNTAILIVCSKKLVGQLKKYGKLSYTKRLTTEETEICEECFYRLWDGYKTGDGYKTHDRSYFSANSSSRGLLLDFQRIFREFGRVSYTYKLRDAGKCVIQGRECNQRELYQLSLVESKRALQSWIYDNILFSKVQSIEKVEKEEGFSPYCLSIENNKNFCVPFAVVKNCEKQNEPVDTSKVYVTEKELHFAYFNVDNKISQSIERGIDRGLVFGALDPSLGKKSKKGDFSVIITIVRDPVTGLIFVVDIDMKRRSVDQQIADVLKFHEKYRYKLFAVETNAFQYVVADAMRKLSKETGAYIPIEEIINYQDKKMRIEGIVPFLKDGTIMFDTYKKKQNNMYARGIEQICTFTGEGEEEDDVPDALEMAFRIAKAPAYRMITKSTRR